MAKEKWVELLSYRELKIWFVNKPFVKLRTRDSASLSLVRDSSSLSLSFAYATSPLLRLTSIAPRQAFAKKYKLPHTLLSDEGNKVRKEWGVPSDLFGTLPGRQTYVLDKDGVVQLIYNNQFQPEKLIDETLKFLQSL
ncbi:hypothetical protein PRUPE_3G139200 [Prunus persica]|uniref:Peroxiredoxin Q, chloroplastic n=1 Tax=Prunus persica TaxID=3760 RepID=M5VH39_PRUPE|nr:hypothetical protein PRUPE_3G139200 [Prunus persica]